MLDPDSPRSFPPAEEANFDGLVGPTHNYAGLAAGNLASQRNAEQRSNPRDAARQGLAKMRWLSDLGLAQGVLPPQERPHLPTLRALGWSGRDAELLYRVRREDPTLLAAISSASSMWAANAATVSPSADTADARVHLTPANLVSHRHRAIEAPVSARLLARTFPDPQYFTHHAALEATPECADEGAANQLRLAPQHGDPGLELFVYGREGSEPEAVEHMPARQARAASEALVRQHRLTPTFSAVVQQSAVAIEAGAFHNDVVAVAQGSMLLFHESAFADTGAVRASIARALGPEFRPRIIEVRETELLLAEAVECYLFNSQLIDAPGGGLWLICAQECVENARAWRLIEQWIDDAANPIRGVQAFDLRESMRNGGGPACLRLRVVLTAAERAAVNPRSWITPERHVELLALIDRYYRDRLDPADLADPALLDESRTVLDRLTQLLGLGSVYDFQR